MEYSDSDLAFPFSFPKKEKEICMEYYVPNAYAPLRFGPIVEQEFQNVSMLPIELVNTAAAYLHRAGYVMWCSLDMHTKALSACLLFSGDSPFDADDFLSSDVEELPSALRASFSDILSGMWLQKYPVKFSPAVIACPKGIRFPEPDRCDRRWSLDQHEALLSTSLVDAGPVIMDILKNRNLYLDATSQDEYRSASDIMALDVSIFQWLYDRYGLTGKLEAGPTVDEVVEIHRQLWD